jgi:hypothetical protein
MINAGIKAALKTTNFDMWRHEPNKVIFWLKLITNFTSGGNFMNSKREVIIRNLIIFGLR